MDSASLHSELVEVGENLIDAVSAERQAKAARNGNSSPADIVRSQAARAGVTRAAERYATTLENYRKAIMSEVAAEIAPPSHPPGPVGDAPERARAAGASSGTEDGAADQDLRHPQSS